MSRNKGLDILFCLVAVIGGRHVDCHGNQTQCCGSLVVVAALCVIGLLMSATKVCAFSMSSRRTVAGNGCAQAAFQTTVPAFDVDRGSTASLTNSGTCGAAGGRT